VGERKGVCQDIAHVALGALRSVGIPARYVSGYLHPDAGAAIGQTVIGESHAWWSGTRGVARLRPHQPRRGRRAARARGSRPRLQRRLPLRGVYAGPSSSALFVSVEITRVA
jgi:hypothetical protein